MDQVFAHLAQATEPQTVGQVADTLGITAGAAMHALQNLCDASRITRDGHSKPHAYELPRLNLHSNRTDFYLKYTDYAFVRHVPTNRLTILSSENLPIRSNWFCR